jgi:hypothetical protein
MKQNRRRNRLIQTTCRRCRKMTMSPTVHIVGLIISALLVVVKFADLYRQLGH